MAARSAPTAFAAVFALFPSSLVAEFLLYVVKPPLKLLFPLVVLKSQSDKGQAMLSCMLICKSEQIHFGFCKILKQFLTKKKHPNIMF